MSRRAVLTAVLATVGVACAPHEIAGTEVQLNADANLEQYQHFFDFPYPSDLRLDATGHPDLAGFPNEIDNATVANLLPEVALRKGFPVIPVAWFQFSAALPALDPTVIVPAGKTSSLMLIDVDPESPERGKLFPVFATVLVRDNYTPANVLALSAPTGFVLAPARKYAFVVLRTLKDASGAPLGSPLVMEQLKGGVQPSGAHGAALKSLYAPLWPALQKAGVNIPDVAAATVFTTGDVVQDLETLSSALHTKYTTQITNLAANPNGDWPTFCDVMGQITLPQFQSGTAPFNTDGHFVLGADGLPIHQGDETVPLHITLPKNTPMPAAGFPLMLFIHGSGGLSSDLPDWGYTSVVGGNPAPGGGPGFVVAQYGIAGASDAMPLNPERFPGATDYEYLNFSNPAAFPSTFQQGVIEQRIFLDALGSLQITPSEVTGCTNLTLPAGQTAFHFDVTHEVAMGHSMGAMYLNMLASVEPRLGAVVMSGAGGYWMNFIFETSLIPDATMLLAALLNSNSLSVLHPVMHMIETAWEPAEPIVYVPRVAHRPLAGSPARPVYEPVGTGDTYFPEPVLDDVALAYGNQEAGQILWETMQPKLALQGLQGLATYPASQNRTSENGSKYTGIVAQYANDGIRSGHIIAFQLDAVKHQYACFLDSFVRTGTATVVAPGAVGSPCE